MDNAIVALAAGLLFLAAGRAAGFFAARADPGDEVARRNVYVKWSGYGLGLAFVVLATFFALASVVK